MEPKALDGEIIDPKHYEVETLLRGERTVFAQILGALVGAVPTRERLQEWGAKHPDRLFYSMKLLAGLTGYSEKVELAGDLARQIGKLSDVEVQRRLSEIEGQMNGHDTTAIALIGDASGQTKQ